MSDKIEILRPVLSGTALSMGFAALAMPNAALAQNAGNAGQADTASTSADATNLGVVSLEVEGVGGVTNTNTVAPPVSRMGDSVREVPRTINVVPQEVIEQQKATTLGQALRNVPGITVSTGEGNGGTNGDQYRIRGMAARGDAYVDGLKDFGIYAHDMFNTETVSVVKGPSSDNFGSGGSGGLINQSTKRAVLGNSNQFSAGIGSGETYRGTADINAQIGTNSAIRMNAVLHEEDGWRDYAQNDRKGLALALGTGIGQDTEWQLGLQYLRGDARPDMGVPMVKKANGRIVPLTELGLDPQTSYIRSSDHDQTNHYQATSILSHRLNKEWSLSNDTRVAYFDREFSSTNPGICAVPACLLPTATMTYGAGGGQAYKQDGYGLQNVASAKFEGQAFGLRHRLQIGMDVNYQEDNRKAGSKPNAATLGNQNIWNPKHDYGYTVTYPASTYSVESSTTNIAGFINERLWLNDWLSLGGSLRYDYLHTEVDHTTAGQGSHTTREWSPGVAVIVEPTKDVSAYASYARSFKPIGADIMGAVVNNLNAYPVDGKDYEAETIDTWELGAKGDLLNGRLGLSGAMFLIHKNEGVVVDAAGNVSAGSGEAGNDIQLNGFELGVTGKLTENLSLFLTYANTQSEYRSGSRKGENVDNVPEHAGSLWASYSANTDAIGVDGDLTLASGVRYASGYNQFRSGTDYGYVDMPHTFSWDAMVGYEVNGYNVALNVYNITDHTNYASSFNAARAVPESGRTYMLSVGAKF